MNYDEPAAIKKNETNPTRFGGGYFQSSPLPIRQGATGAAIARFASFISAAQQPLSEIATSSIDSPVNRSCGARRWRGQRMPESFRRVARLNSSRSRGGSGWNSPDILS